MRMTPVEARKLLGLENAVADLTEATITRAYRTALMKYHPDTTTAAAAGWAEAVDVPLAIPLPETLQKAREVLRQAATGANSACAQCRGRGKVPSKVGAVTCGACKGTGDTAP